MPMSPCVESLCFFLFGMSGWWVFNTFSAEQPDFTACNTSSSGGGGNNSSGSDLWGEPRNSSCTLPEGLSLSSQISVTSQLGNIVPLLYRVIVKYCCATPSGRKRRLSDPEDAAPRKLCVCARSLRVPIVILVSLLAGLFAALLASFKWDTWTYIFGSYHSVVLLVCCFMSGGLGCMSSIVYWQFASMYSSGIAATKALSIGMAAGGLFPCILALLQHMDELGPGLHDISSFSTPNVMLWISSVIQALFIVLFIVIWRGNARRAAAIEADELEKQAAADDAAAEASGQVGAEDSDATAEWSDSSDDGLNKDAEGGRKTKRHRRSKRPSRPRGSEKSPANRLVHTPSSMAVVFDPVPSTSRRNSRTRSISGSENGPATDVYRSARRDKGRSSRASSRASWAEDLDRPLLGGGEGELVDPVSGVHDGDNSPTHVFHAEFDLGITEEEEKRRSLLHMGGEKTRATEQDEEVGLGQRPTLPSVDSLRGRAVKAQVKKEVDEDLNNAKRSYQGKWTLQEIGTVGIIAVLYFCTYSLPALIPIIIHYFPNKEGTYFPNYMSVYILINVGYTIGDFLGRMVTVLPCVPSWTVLRILTVVVVGLFIIQILAAIFAQALCASLVDPSLQPPSLITLDNYTVYACGLIATQFLYYFLRGYVVTNTYVRIKKDYNAVSSSVLAGAAGTVGQVGAAIGTLIAFLLVTVFDVFQLNN